METLDEGKSENTNLTESLTREVFGKGAVASNKNHMVLYLFHPGNDFSRQANQYQTFDQKLRSAISVVNFKDKKVEALRLETSSTENFHWS